MTRNANTAPRRTMSDGVLVDVDWKLGALCREHPADLWFPVANGGAWAIGICRQCPVRRPCGIHAIRTGERRGIAAGFRCGSSQGRTSLCRWLGMAAPVTARACSTCGTPLHGGRFTLCRPCRYQAPLQPVLDHVAALREGQAWTLQEIADRAGMGLSTLKKILYSPTKDGSRYTSDEHATRILAVKAPNGRGHEPSQ